MNVTAYFVVAEEIMEDVNDEFLVESDNENVVDNINGAEEEKLRQNGLIVLELGMMFKNKMKCLSCTRVMLMI